MPRRPGYTLLEVILAVAIGMLIFAALYVALNVQFRYMANGRNAVSEGQFARGLLARISADIRMSLAYQPPPQNSGQTPTTTTSTTTETQDQTTVTGRFNYGIQGDDTQITLFVSTVPRFSRLETGTQSGVSDLRRITYWRSGNDGLARQEVRKVTAAEVLPDEAPLDILAAEVVNLRFQYFDPSSGTWQPSWDGTMSNGPPLAVKVEMWIVPPLESTLFGARAKPATYYSTVVAIPSASIPQALVDQMSGQTPTGQ